MSALRSNAVFPEVTPDNEHIPHPVEAYVRPQKLPPLLQTSISGELGTLPQAAVDRDSKDSTKEMGSRSLSDESVVSPLSDTESPDVRCVHRAPLSPSASPLSPSKSKSVIDFGLARRFRQRYSSHYVSSRELNDAEEGQSSTKLSGKKLPRVSEMLSDRQLKEDAKKLAAAKKIATRTWDTTEEGKPVDRFRKLSPWIGSGR